MTMYRSCALVALIMATVFCYAAATPKAADERTRSTDFATLEAIQNAANATPGPRAVPGRSIPVPHTVSSQLQAAIAAPYSASWDIDPKSAAEWKALIDRSPDAAVAVQKSVREKLGVTLEPTVIGGVRAFILSPREIPPANRNRLLVHLHGGAYVFNSGEAGTAEATMMAAYGGFRVISIDYRMPPDHPFPAAVDDAMAVWREAVKTTDPRNMAIFGTSAGGGLTLAMILRAKQEGLALPGAIAPGSPWADLTETGDTFKTNEWLDNVVVSYNGSLRHAAELYANGHDLKEPLLSPIYGDFTGFPPAILTSGTRDLFLSLTVLTHRKLRRAGVEADLQVFEGMSHGDYQSDPFAPETKEAFTEIARFFDKHLGN